MTARISPFVILGAIILIAIAMAALLGYIDHHFDELTLSLKESSHERGEFNWHALSLLHTGTFNNGGPGFASNMLRGPGYATVLAGSFLLFGEKLGAIYILNLLFFLLSIVLLWRVSGHFLSGKWVFLPSLMLALFWGFDAHVWTRNYELYVLFFSLLAFKGFLRYQETRSPLWLMPGTIAYALWMLEKPIILYSVPFVLFLPLLSHREIVKRKETIAHALIFLLVLASVVGPWMIRNWVVLDTFQLGTGGHSLLRRSTQVDYPALHLINLAFSFSLGDVITSKLSSSYPSDGKPAAWDHAVESRWYQQGWYITEPNGEVITRIELDRRMYKEAFANILRKPFKFLLSSPLGFLRLNAPVNHGGQEIMHLFWGTKLFGSGLVTIAVLLIIRLIWFAFLGIVFWMLISHLPLWRTHWGLILFFIIYVNLMYGLLTHAEARYIFTMMPLYFILFAEGVRQTFKKFFYE